MFIFLILHVISFTMIYTFLWLKHKRRAYEWFFGRHPWRSTVTLIWRFIITSLVIVIISLINIQCSYAVCTVEWFYYSLEVSKLILNQNNFYWVKLTKVLVIPLLTASLFWLLHSFEINRNCHNIHLPAQARCFALSPASYGRLIQSIELPIVAIIPPPTTCRVIRQH